MYQKTPQRPVGGLPMETSLQECIVMDYQFHVLSNKKDHKSSLILFSNPG